MNQQIERWEKLRDHHNRIRCPKVAARYQRMIDQEKARLKRISEYSSAHSFSI